MGGLKPKYSASLPRHQFSDYFIGNNDIFTQEMLRSHSRPPRPKNGSIPFDKFDSIIFEEIQESERMFVRLSLSKTTFLIPG